MSVMTSSSEVQRKKIHPHKFAMWVAIGSILMMFAGLTSAYVVKSSSGNWRNYQLPYIFWFSTVVIILSSISFIYGIRAFRKRQMPLFKKLITATVLLGLLFGVMQFIGFYQLYHVKQQVIYNGTAQNIYEPVTISGNPSESFLFIIAGLHLVHILGGVIALLIVFFKAFRRSVKLYHTTGLEVVATYWHFVDLLWIYLFVFFLAYQ